MASPRFLCVFFSFYSVYLTLHSPAFSNSQQCCVDRLARLDIRTRVSYTITKI